MALAAFLVAAVGLLFGYVIGNDPGESGDAAGFVIVVVITAAITWLVFEYLIPRWEQPGAETARNGLILSVLALITVPAFWLGLPWVLGAGGALLGQTAKERSGEAGDGKATAAVVIGVLAFVAATAIVIVDEVG